MVMFPLKIVIFPLKMVMFPLKIVMFPLKIVIFPLKMVMFPLKIVMFPLKIVIFPLKMVIFHVFSAKPLAFGSFEFLSKRTPITHAERFRTGCAEAKEGSDDDATRACRRCRMPGIIPVRNIYYQQK